MAKRKDVEREDFYRRVNLYSDVVRASKREVDYLSTEPEPFIVQIPLFEYFERIKRHKADKWQKDFCNRLQKALENRHFERFWAIFHAEAQLGKTSILSQAFPAWILGHQPLFKYALATYNQTKSTDHSLVVINIMRSEIHRDIFPAKEGWIPDGLISKEKWSTFARLDLNDGQSSFNPVGLQSGLTGSGFDWLTIDDPYKESKEAFSEVVRKNMQNFWEYTVVSRVSPFSCVAGMFHRYAPEDFAGYLLDKGEFDYVRYASQCDGDYVHHSTGQVFPDPLGREVGEYISERREPSYYEGAKKNRQVWLSMFQGRPTHEEGSFFNIGRIVYSDDPLKMQDECVIFVRAWDNASTEEGGAYTVGVLMGIRPDGSVVIFDVYRQQVDTAERYAKQRELARADTLKYGSVIITVPQDAGSAGKDTVFQTKQELQGFIVNARPTSGSKEMRALNFSASVNSGRTTLLKADWNKDAVDEFRNFPLSDYKDVVDASSDAFNELSRLLLQGRVIHSFDSRHLMTRDYFRATEKREGKDYLFTPKYNVFVGVKVAPDNSRPTSGVMVARAPYASNFHHEDLFVFAEYKAFDVNFYLLFDWINARLRQFIQNKSLANASVWLHRDSAHLLPTLTEKVGANCGVFEGDQWVGLSELNWHFKSRHISLLVDPEELDTPQTENGLVATRREIPAWGFTDRGDPTPVGAVLDCLRMCVAQFATYSTPLTEAEEYERKLRERLPPRLLDPEFVARKVRDGEFAPDMTYQMAKIIVDNELRRQGENVLIPTIEPDEDELFSMEDGW